MVNNDKENQCYHILFDDYKAKLSALGVPIMGMGDKKLNLWFQRHLNKLRGD